MLKSTCTETHTRMNRLTILGGLGRRLGGGSSTRAIKADLVENARPTGGSKRITSQKRHGVGEGPYRGHSPPILSLISFLVLFCRERLTYGREGKESPRG